jgi:hypothetical protein
MRVGLVRAVALLLFAVVPLAQCGGRIAGGSDGGPDAPVTTSCSSGADCPSGQHCFFPIGEGCAATGECHTGSITNCKGGVACTCGGETAAVVCGPPGYATTPVEHTGPCEDATPPPPPCSGLACEMCDTTGFSPPVMSSPLSEYGACSAAQISGFVDACIGPNATAQACAAWQSAPDAGACSSCVFTTQTAAAWGPLVCTSTMCEFNVGGCVDLELGTVAAEQAAGGPGSCGDLFTTSYACQDYACGTCDTTDFSACDQSAIANECAAYVAPTEDMNGPCAPLVGDATTAQTMCFAQDAASIAGLINVFCGTGP